MFKRKKRTKRKQLGLVRSWKAAQQSRLLEGWRSDCGYTAREIKTYLPVLRGRSREMAKNNPHMRKYIELFKTNVPGRGFSFKALPHDIRNGVPTLDQGAATFIEYHYNRFCTHRDPLTTLSYFDLSGMQTAPEMDRTRAESWVTDGEYFTEIVYGSDLNPYGVAFRPIRPDACPVDYNVSNTGKGTEIVCGVEKSLTTRHPINYYFTTGGNGDVCIGATRPYVKIPASRMIHGFTSRDENQPRGIPLGAESMVKLKMLEMYDEAELTAARDEACTVATYEAKDDSQSEDGLMDLTDADNSEAANALTMEKQPGQNEIIPPGWTRKVNTPQHPSREVTAFKNSMLRDVATGFGVEYANFANDWAGVSFSSVRGGTIAERDHWMIIQDDMIAQCKQIEYLVWLNSFLSMPISGGLPLAKLDKFSEHKINGRRWQWVDPLKDMRANEVAVVNHWKTNTEVTAELGGDYMKNLGIAEREMQAEEDKGLTTETEVSQ